MGEDTWLAIQQQWSTFGIQHDLNSLHCCTEIYYIDLSKSEFSLKNVRRECYVIHGGSGYVVNRIMTGRSQETMVIFLKMQTLLKVDDKSQSQRQTEQNFILS